MLLFSVYFMVSLRKHTQCTFLRMIRKFCFVRIIREISGWGINKHVLIIKHRKVAGNNRHHFSTLFYVEVASKSISQRKVTPERETARQTKFPTCPSADVPSAARTLPQSPSRTWSRVRKSRVCKESHCYPCMYFQILIKAHTILH